MTIHLNTVLTIGKAFAIKREKDDHGEVTRAHLKFTDLFITREQVNAICGMRPGWAETAFFDELGAPFGDWSLVLHQSSYSLAGAINAPDGEGLRFTAATLDGLELTMTKLGAAVAGQITWLVAGDEAGGAEPLLGRQCRAEWHLSDGGQRDMLKEQAA